MKTSEILKDIIEKARQLGDTKIGSDGKMRVWSKTPSGFDWRRVKGSGDKSAGSNVNSLSKLTMNSSNEELLKRANNLVGKTVQLGLENTEYVVEEIEDMGNGNSINNSGLKIWLKEDGEKQLVGRKINFNDINNFEKQQTKATTSTSKKKDVKSSSKSNKPKSSNDESSNDTKEANNTISDIANGIKKIVVKQEKSDDGKEIKFTVDGIEYEDSGKPIKSEKKPKASTLGKTQSGKWVFENKKYDNKSYNDFTAQDHLDASKFHKEKSKEWNEKVTDRELKVAYTPGNSLPHTVSKRDNHDQKRIDHEIRSNELLKKEGEIEKALNHFNI